MSSNSTHFIVANWQFMVKIRDKQQFNKFWGQLRSNVVSLTGLNQLFLVIAAHTEVSSYLADRS